MLSGVIIIFLLLLILWILFSDNKAFGKMARAVNMALFSVRFPEGKVPKDVDLINSFAGFHSAGWNRLLYGEPYAVLEKVFKRDKTEFYVAVPKNYEYLAEEKLRELFPEAEISKSEGHSPMSHDAWAGAVLTPEEREIRPRFHPHEFKLADDEELILQILARHSHRKPGTFESNFRILARSDSRQKAIRILDDFKERFHSLETAEVKKRAMGKFVVKFALRLFEDKETVFLEPKEINRLWFESLRDSGKI